MPAVIILSGLLPPVLWTLFIRSRDRDDREPWRAVIGAFLLGAVPVVTLTLFVGARLLDVGAFLGVVVEAPLVEESLKLLALLAFGLVVRAYDEPVDGMVYGAAIGFGFAAVENILYFNVQADQAPETLATLIVLRSFGSAVMHGVVAAWVGHAHGLVRHAGGTWGAVLVALGQAMAIHMVWNAMSFLGLAGLIVNVILLPIFIVRGFVPRFRRSLAESPGRQGGSLGGRVNRPASP